MNKAQILKEKAYKYLPDKLEKHYNKILEIAEDKALSGKFSFGYKIEDNQLELDEAASIVRVLRVDGFNCFIESERTLEGYDEHLIIVDWG